MQFQLVFFFLVILLSQLGLLSSEKSLPGPGEGASDGLLGEPSYSNLLSPTDLQVSVEPILTASVGGSEQRGNLSFVFDGPQLRKVGGMRGKINTGSNWARIRCGFKAAGSSLGQGWMLTGILSHEHVGDASVKGSGLFIG